MTMTKQHSHLMGWHHPLMLCLTILALLVSLLPLRAQDAQTKRMLRRAAEAYKDKDYATATERLGEVLQRDSTSLHGHYALGNAYYRQEKYEEAARHYGRALERGAELSAEQTATLLHNMGNIAMRARQYDTAIDCYQKALIQMPSDNDTRYNLVLAQKLKKQQEQDDKKQQDKDKQDKQDQQQKQQPPQDKQQDNKEEKQQPPPQQPKQDEQQPAQPQPQDGGLTPQQAEQILNAFKQNDERTRRRVEQLQREQEAERNNQTRRKW